MEKLEASPAAVEKVRKNAKVVKADATPKRKKIVLNFTQKVEVLEKLKSGIRVVDLAKEYNIGLSTVCDIRKYGNEKLLQFRKDHLFSMNRKTFKAPDFPLLDKALRIWVYQERTKNYILTDAIFATKALQFFKELYPNSKKVFKASYGYIDKFCKRYEITLRNEPSKMYADLSKLDAFILDFRSLNYTPEQIYSADECGLYYSDLPVLKDSKEYLTLMMCCNASGKHRLPLVLVNNVENPACFQVVDGTNKRRHIDKSTLPVRYTHSPRGWITLEIFEQWFHGEFVPKVRAHLASLNQEEKAILLIDNCPAHPMKLESADGKIKGLFLPPESSALIMPMNQGPISYLKRKYRTNLLRNATLHKQWTDNYNIKQAIYALSSLWREMPDELLCSSWHKLNMNLDCQYNYETIDMGEIRANITKLGFELSDHVINCWLDTDYGDPGYGFLTDQEILDQCRNSHVVQLTNVQLDDDDNDVSVPNTTSSSTCNSHTSGQENTSAKVIPAKQAFNHCNELMVWLEEHKLSKPDDLVSMQRIKELASQHLIANGGNSNVPQSLLNGELNQLSSVVNSASLVSLYIEQTEPIDSQQQPVRGHVIKFNDSGSETKSVTTFLDEDDGNVAAGKLNESGGEIDKSVTTFLDEENTGNVMRLEGSSIEKKTVTRLL